MQTLFIIPVLTFLAVIFSGSAALAQAASPSAGLEAFLPLILVFVIIYFLIIRPQSKRQKEHKAMLDALRRGDVVVTQGGLIGKIAKVDDTEIQLDIADNIRVSVMRTMIATLHSTETDRDADSRKAKKN